MKRIVKSLEELRATEGVTERDGSLRLNGVGNSFTQSMYCMCGKELTGKPTSETQMIYHENFRYYPWMWKEVEESPAEGLEFPCEMEVWDDENDNYKPELAATHTVYGYVPTLSSPWVGYAAHWKHAKPIEFKPRYVWVKFGETSGWCIVEEVSSDEFYLADDKSVYSTEDFYKIGPEVIPPDL